MKIGTVITILDNNWKEMYMPLFDAGFDYFELLPENQDVYTNSDLKKYFKNKEVILHAPFTTNNFLSSNRFIRQASYKHLKKTLSPLVEFFQPKVISLHFGSVPFFNQKYHFDYLIKLKSIFPQITVENMPPKANIWNIFYPSTDKEVNELIENLDINLTFDVGHWEKQGLDANKFIKKYGKRISHIHIHDILNGVDHRELGSGVLDIEKLLFTLKAVKYRGGISIELVSDNVTGAINSLEVLKKYMKGI